jgi:hypothetical protein
MNPEFLSDEPIVLSTYVHGAKLLEECQQCDSPQHYVEKLLAEHRHRPYITDVVAPMINIMESHLSDGTAVDPDKNTSRALLSGALIAASAIDKAGGSYVADSLELTFPTRTTAEMTPTKATATHCDELWDIGTRTYYAKEYAVYQVILEQWGKSLAGEYEPQLHVGFGVMMYLASQKITAMEQHTQELRKALNELADEEVDWDAELRKLSESQ